MTIYSLAEHLNTNVFLNNKYSAWYVQLIINAQQRARLKTNVERHHFIPKSMGGTHTVALTIREHFIAHWLLTKITTSEHKARMCYAFMTMCRMSRYNGRVTSRSYEHIKIIAKNHIKGKNAYNYDHTIYDFYHNETDRHVRMVRSEFCREFGMYKSGVGELTSGKLQFLKGWRLSDIPATRYSFLHSATNTIVNSTKKALVIAYNLHPGNINELVLGNRKSVSGWSMHLA